MRWQLRFQDGQQRIAVQRQAGLRYHIAHQLTGIAAGVCGLVDNAGMGHRLGHIGQGQHRPVDFSQFNALTANFQLIVAAA